MTITEKILAAHAGLDVVRPGQIIKAKVDFALANDITAPLAIKAFKSAGGKKVSDKDKIALINKSNTSWNLQPNLSCQHHCP